MSKFRKTIPRLCVCGGGRRGVIKTWFPNFLTSFPSRGRIWVDGDWFDELSKAEVMLCDFMVGS